MQRDIKKRITTDKEALLDVLYKNEKEILSLKERVNSVCERHGLEDAEVLYLIRKSGSANSFPAEILAQSLSPLEAVVSFLRQNKGLRFSDIAKLLNRDERTIWVTFDNSRHKQRALSIPGRSRVSVPIAIIKDRRLSILESVSLFLKEKKGLTLTEISNLLKKNTSTIWTALNRAEKKFRRGACAGRGGAR